MEEFPNTRNDAAFEDARRRRIDAETARDKHNEKVRRRQERSTFVRWAIRNKKRLAVVLLVVAVAIIAVFGVALPAVFSKQVTEYYSVSSLEEIVQASNLSTVEYVYTGIANKDPQKFLLMETDSGFRVRYTARVRVSFDLTKIKLEENEEKKTIIVTYPEPVIEDPVLEEGSLSFIPENYPGDLKEIIKLCKDDSIEEITADSNVKEMATENLENTIRALVEPLIPKGYTVEFK